MGTDLDLIRHFKSTASSSDFQHEVLKQDVNHNGRLDPDDLTQRYGTGAANFYYDALKKSVLNNDPKTFTGTLGKLETARQKLLQTLFTAKVAEHRTELEALGVKFDGSKFSCSNVSAGNQPKVAQILRGAFEQAYAKEFRAMSPQEEKKFQATLEDRVRDHANLKRMNSTDHYQGIAALADQVLFAENERWSDHPVLQSEQEKYADETFHEIHQSAEVTALENKYGLDIRVSGRDVTPAECQTLDRVLGRLRALRPADFARLPSLTLNLAMERIGGETFLDQNRRIELYGPFSPAPKAILLPSAYTEGMSQIMAGDNETYLTHVLAHEMGHSTESANVMAFYAKTFPRMETRVREELLAEDYRTFLLSGGTSVPVRDGAHREIGHEAERLALMRATYPLNP